jgi:hypothetical protein
VSGTISLSREERLFGVFTTALAAGAEGLVVKRLDTPSAYEPSKRSDGWVKVRSFIVLQEGIILCTLVSTNTLNPDPYKNSISYCSHYSSVMKQ